MQRVKYQEEIWGLNELSLLVIFASFIYVYYEPRIRRNPFPLMQTTVHADRDKHSESDRDF